MDQVRVLQVIGAMNRAGAETIVMNLMRSIDRDRVHFDFLVHEQKRCDYDDEIEALGGTIYRIPRYNVANGPAYRRICKRFFAEHPEIDVVHGHIGSSSAIYLDEAKKAGCATVVHSHRDSPKAKTIKSRVRRNFYGALIRKVPGIADEFLACGYQAGVDRFGVGVAAGPHFHVMNNGIDLSKYTCDERDHEEAKARLGYAGVPLVGNVARLVPEKNQAFLLEVFAKALEANPRARLVLAGRGPTEEALRAQAASLGIADSVEFLGVRDDIPEVLKALDAFVFTSTLEGLGMAVVEAQAAGAPCITSDAVPQTAIVSGIAQRISLDEGVDEWARRLNDVLAAAEPHRSQVDEVRAHGYDIAEVASWMADFYCDLAARAPRNREGAR
ncbi:MAG: glycosyltransferase family 1 protein [Coriobacteriaceae bacterium]|nr:glycosyltransferase family 1 protein [Coriobacteriaceae bacterium]